MTNKENYIYIISYVAEKQINEIYQAENFA